MKMFEKGFHGLALWTAEYMGEIPQAPLCENLETFTVAFLGYRPTNAPLFFGKKSTFYG